MYVEYDKFNLLERPTIILCNPNRTELFSLGNIFNTNISLKYNALSTFTFDLMEIIQDANNNDVIDPAYALLKAKRLVWIEEFGYFQISLVTENRDGKVPVKAVECTSWESELINKQINSFKANSIKLFDPVSNEKTFIGLILAGTNWTVGDVTTDLWDIYRDFDIATNNVYNTLMTVAETAYNCIFTFDPFERLVNITSIAKATFDTDIFLSFENLLQKTSFKEISEEIVTAMNVYGGGTGSTVLDIRSVNPLGTNKIYDFSYYQSRDQNDNLLWISIGLNTAIDNWMAKIDDNLLNYSNLLVSLKTLNAQLAANQLVLADLYDHDNTPPLGYGLNELIEIQKARIEGGLPYDDINTLIASKQAAIDTRNGVIHSINNNITSTTTQIKVINDDLAITNIVNFTLVQQEELNPLIIDNDYQNSNIIVTSIMTPIQVQDQATQLYNQAKDVLSRNSQPRYEFTVESANFFALKEYNIFTQQLGLGSNITIENKEGEYIVTAVLEINMSFDHLDNFSLIFSNRLRLDDGSFVNSDLFGSVVKGATSVSFNSGIWNQYNTVKDDVLMIDSILNATNNQIISSTNQEITLSGRGLQGKKKLPNGNYSPNQVWLTSQSLAFSSDSFQTAGLALGQIALPSGGTAFGLAASAIFGNLLAGNQLRISNSGGNFVLDQNGAVLTDATFTITSSAARPNSIILSPSTGISIKNKVGVTVFGADGNGNITFKGTLSGVNGTFNGTLTTNVGNIGGLIIDSSGLRTVDGNNYLRNDNSFKWGPFSVDTNNNGTFNGTFDANQIRVNGHIINGMIANNTIQSGKIGSINADVITSGKIRGIDIWGSIISWGGATVDAALVKMYGSINPITLKQDIALIQAQGGIQMMYVDDTFTWQNGMGKMLLGLNTTKLFAQQIEIGDYEQSGTNIVLSGVLDLSNIYQLKSFGGRTGKTGNYNVNTTIGVYRFTFANGILVDAVLS